VPENAPVPLNRTERVLAAMILAIIAVSLLAIISTMLAAGAGTEMSGGIWPSLMLVGYIGLPIAFLLIVAFLIVSARRRRTSRDGER
jgi:TRAP-type C4-dicarboxylate transport system permease small subunit